MTVSTTPDIVKVVSQYADDIVEVATPQRHVPCDCSSIEAIHTLVRTPSDNAETLIDQARNAVISKIFTIAIGAPVIEEFYHSCFKELLREGVQNPVFFQLAHYGVNKITSQIVLSYRQVILNITRHLIEELRDLEYVPKTISDNDGAHEEISDTAVFNLQIKEALDNPEAINRQINNQDIDITYLRYLNMLVEDLNLQTLIDRNPDKFNLPEGSSVDQIRAFFRRNDFSLVTEFFLSNIPLTRLPNELFALRNIQKISVTRGYLRFIPRWIFSLHSLRFLTFTSNRIYAIPEAVGQSNYLEAINLKQNRIVSLPFGLSRAYALKILHLDNNRLLFTDIEHAIISRMSLELLTLYDNPSCSIPESVKRALDNRVMLTPESSGASIHGVSILQEDQAGFEAYDGGYFAGWIYSPTDTDNQDST